jgi:hypothetical protein
MDCRNSFYFGNAALDQVRGSGWFIGQFVPAELGLRHQADIEVKWGVHKDGERRSHPQANGNATTISVLIRGALRVQFQVDETTQAITLQKAGDYVIFGSDVVHTWEAIGDTVVLSIRFPSVEVSEGRRHQMVNEPDLRRESGSAPATPEYSHSNIARFPAPVVRRHNLQPVFDLDAGHPGETLDFHDGPRQTTGMGKVDIASDLQSAARRCCPKISYLPGLVVAAFPSCALIIASI